MNLPAINQQDYDHQKQREDWIWEKAIEKLVFWQHQPRPTILQNRIMYNRIYLGLSNSQPT